MANLDLPEDVIVNILERLPVESLIRCSCVSKRWRSVILSDLQFAKSHYTLASQQRTLRRRLLLSTASRIESLDLQTPSFGNSSVRKLTCPFRPSDKLVWLLGSSNGLACLSLGSYQNLNLWNPSTGFFQRIPDPGQPSGENLAKFCYGFGYSSALKDYKVFIAILNRSRKSLKQVRIFSVRTQLWTGIETRLSSMLGRGALLNDALHWLVLYGRAIVAFDLASEEVREMPLPILGEDNNGDRFQHIGVSFEGCLCVTNSARNVYDCFCVWVMREYGVPASWTKLYNINISESLEQISYSCVMVVMEKSVVLVSWGGKDWDKNIVMKVDHENGNRGEYALPKCGPCDFIEYEESLLWINE